MKIIKKGRNLAVIEFKCSWCGCVFECEHSEYTVEEDDRGYIYAIFNCPNCKKSVSSKEDGIKIPNNML